jgi:hypothetical protein
MKNIRRQTPRLRFPVVPLAVALNNRKGKHGSVVWNVFCDLERIDEDSALKIDLTKVGQKKADLRSALHREAKKRAITLLTTSDDTHLYVFRKQAGIQRGR